MLVVVPIFDNTSNIDTTKLTSLEYMMEYKRKLPRTFSSEFCQSLVHPNNGSSFNNQVVAHRTTGRSLSGTGRLDYMVYVRCLHTDNNNETHTFMSDPFYEFIRWYEHLNMANTYIYIPHKLENMLTNDEWSVVLRMLIKKNMHNPDVNFEICKPTKFNTRTEEYASVRATDSVFSF